MLVRFESGARGALALSSVSAGHPYRVRFEIDAENSGVTWDSETASELWIGHRDRPNEVLWPDPRVFSPGALAYADSPARIARASWTRSACCSATSTRR